ncbi:MAG: xanthine dehydrogenase family protein molybdopterin-binding subunit [Collimonas pratensis]|uniref:xanthine dehydrogenase family protein molybdopterin-binding subunit n=1 Tax=Collimonas pratensis TaxID=279113 RepID=UPI003C79400F
MATLDQQENRQQSANFGEGIGASLPRIDAPQKVSGRAMYTSDHRFPGMLTAVPVCATIANGVVRHIDVSAAKSMPGVHRIFTHENIGNFFHVNSSSGAKIDERRPPLDDTVIRYYGQYVALVVADRFEQASAAAAAVRVDYLSEAPNVEKMLTATDKLKTETERGDVDTAFSAAAITLDHTYTTPVETHNPIELHASVALFDGNAFTLYETSQAIVNHREVMSQMLGVPAENVRIITEYLGSGFGGKLWPWSHSLLAARAARILRRPIKLVVSRAMMFHNVGHRANTQQRIRLSATANGKLTSLQQDYLFHIAQTEDGKEQCGESTAYLYGCDNLRVRGSPVRRHIAPNTSMRGPGAVPGLFATESAMDELALQLGLDPLQLRLQNEPAIDQHMNVPFSSRHLSEAMQTGADRFGWGRRNPAVGSMRQDGEILGWGMAACSWMASRVAAQATVTLSQDGSARIFSAAQDIGTGTYTVIAQMVADATGIPIAKIVVTIGNTDLPPGPMSGGSMATASMVPAIAQAIREAIAQMLAVASVSPQSAFHGLQTEMLAFTAGRVHRKDQAPSSGVPFAEILQAAKLSGVDGKGKSGARSVDADANEISIHSYGAHFVEVRWQPEIARLYVSRVVTVIDAGRIINPRTGRNQIEGAIVMGIGMALFEETHYDAHNGKPVNNNLADYVMATHADSPEIDVVFLDYPDQALDELGARGIGEIGIAGLAPAVTAAVYHATGVRVRDLPVKIEDLLKASCKSS